MSKLLPVGPDGLNDKERRFVNEYFIDLNPYAAWARCGMKGSPQRMMDKPNVKAAIEARAMIENDRYAITRERILEEYATMAFGKITDYLVKTPAGEYVFDLSVLENDPRIGGAIADLQLDEYMEGRGEDAERVKKTRIKLHDKKSALEFLAKYVGLASPERIEITGKDGGPIQTKSDVSLDLSGLDIEDLEALNAIAEKVAAKAAGGGDAP